MSQAKEEAKKETPFAVTTTVPGFIAHAEIISALRAKYHGVVYDVSNPTGMAKAVIARKELREARVALDKRKPEVKREALDFCAKVEADYKAIRAAVSEYEDVADEAIKQEEARKEAIKAEKARIDAERVAGVRERIQKLNNIPLMAAGMPSAELEILIARVRAQQIGSSFAEFENEAEQAKAEVLTKLDAALTFTVQAEEEAARVKAEQEAEALRLEALRIEQEKAAAAERERLAIEKAKQDRLNAIEQEKIAAERAELEKLREADRKRQAEADEIAAAKEAELNLEREKIRKQQEELNRQERERQEKEAAEQAERDRIAKEKAEKEAEEKRRAELRKAEEAHEAALAKATTDHKTTLENILAAAEDQTLAAPAALQLIIMLAKRGLGRKA